MIPLQKALLFILSTLALGFLPFSVWAKTDNGKKKTDPYGREVKPDILFQAGVFLFDLTSRVKFAGDESFYQLQNNLQLDRYGSFLSGTLTWRYLQGKLSLSFGQNLLQGRHPGPSVPLQLGGQTFPANVAITTRQRVSRLDGTWYRSLLPPQLEGLRLFFLLHVQYLALDFKVQNDLGQQAKVKFGSFIPTLGVRIEYDVLFAEPEKVEEVFAPRPTLSFIFDVRGLAFLDYPSRRVDYFYELWPGVIYSPTEFLTFTFAYRMWEFRLKRVRQKQTIHLLWEGFFLACMLKF